MKKMGNNAGMSLIELLVALAAASMVMVAVLILLINGTESYRRQTLQSQLQQDADIALNQISDGILEASVIEVSNSESLNGSTQEFFITADKKYKYVEAEKILYVTTKDPTSGAFIDSVLCTNVDKFRVQILSSSVKTEKDENGIYQVVGINDTVQVKVTMELGASKVTREASRVTGVRNTISEIKLHFFDATEFPNVEVLKSYGFLVD